MAFQKHKYYSASASPPPPTSPISGMGLSMALKAAEEKLFGRNKPKVWYELRNAINNQGKADQQIIQELANKNLELHAIISSLEGEKEKEEIIVGHHRRSNENPSQTFKKNRNSERSKKINPVAAQRECIIHEQENCKMCVPMKLHDFASYVKAFGETHHFQ